MPIIMLIILVVLMTYLTMVGRAFKHKFTSAVRTHLPTTNDSDRSSVTTFDRLIESRGYNVIAVRNDYINHPDSALQILLNKIAPTTARKIEFLTDRGYMVGYQDEIFSPTLSHTLTLLTPSKHLIPLE